MSGWGKVKKCIERWKIFSSFYKRKKIHSLTHRLSLSLSMWVGWGNDQIDFKKNKRGFQSILFFFPFCEEKEDNKNIFFLVSLFCLTWKPLVLVPPGKENEDNNKNKITTLKIMAGGCSKCSHYWFVLIGS